MKTRCRKKGKGELGQILPVSLIVGGALLLLALAIVSMLSHTVKMEVKTKKGTAATYAGDAALDKTIEMLRTSWGDPETQEFPYLTRYRFDYVHYDIPNAVYVVQVDAGNLVKPPGNSFFERTVTVDVYTFSEDKTPKPNPTPVVPWVRGGPVPTDYVNHRTVQAVVSRTAFNSALSAEGGVVLGGSAEIYWGDVYCYQDVANPAADIALELQTQSVGPGYPAFHTKEGCIRKVSGKGGGAGTFCSISDLGASGFKYYPNDPYIPPKPIIDLQIYRNTARQFYVLNGINSGETGYFYYAPTITTGPGPNSQTVGANPGNESYHQYNAGSVMSWAGKMQPVLDRMRTILGQAANWVGEDNLVFFVDTKENDGVLNADFSDLAIGGGFNGAVAF